MFEYDLRKYQRTFFTFFVIEATVAGTKPSVLIGDTRESVSTEVAREHTLTKYVDFALNFQRAFLAVFHDFHSIPRQRRSHVEKIQLTVPARCNNTFGQREKLSYVGKASESFIQNLTCSS